MLAFVGSFGHEFSKSGQSCEEQTISSALTSVNVVISSSFWFLDIPGPAGASMFDAGCLWLTSLAAQLSHRLPGGV